MANINASDIKLIKSERITDFTDGGGRMTGNVVADGVLNEVFSDISQLDRTIGRVSLRKVYLSVATDNTETYLGAHAIITDPPDDTDVQVLMFSTENWTDERSDARNRVESYYIQGVTSPWVLMSDHITGQKSIQIFSNSNADSLTRGSGLEDPQGGDVIMLAIEKAGVPHNFQFLRIAKMASRTIQRYTDISGENFFKDVVVLDLTTALRYDYPGQEVSRATISNYATRIRNTSVADAASYYGVKPVVSEVSHTDSEVSVDSPYAHIVPSAQSETALVDVVAGVSMSPMIKSGVDDSIVMTNLAVSGLEAPAYAFSFYLGSGFLPNSLALTIGSTHLKDDGEGNIVAQSGSTTFSGRADYSSGYVELSNASSWSGPISATATPAVRLSVIAHTHAIEVNSGTRRFSYTATLNPPPPPGSLRVDFRALGKRYRLYDDGNGRVKSLDGSGVGTLNNATGSVSVTLTALPDLNSSVIFSWGSDFSTLVSAGSYPYRPPEIRLQLAHENVKPGSVTVHWTHGGVAKSANDAAYYLSGDGFGPVVYGSGIVILATTLLPDVGTQISVDYDWGVSGPQIFTATANAGNIIFTLPTHPIRPGTLKLTLDSAYGTPKEVHDDGAGGFIPLNLYESLSGGVHIRNIAFSGNTLTISKSLSPGLSEAAFYVDICFYIYSQGWSGQTRAYMYWTGSDPVISFTYAGTMSVISHSYNNITGDLSLVVSFSYSALDTSRNPSISIYYTKYGQSSIPIQGASVNYATGQAILPTEVGGTQYASFNNGAFYRLERSFWWGLAGGLPDGTVLDITANYQLDADGSTTVSGEAFPSPALQLDVLPESVNPLIPGSLRFSFAGGEYVDRSGSLFTAINHLNNAGTLAGTIDYNTGRATLNSYGSGTPTLNVISALTSFGQAMVYEVFFITPTAPLAIGSFQPHAVDEHGNFLTGSVDNNGLITGAYMRGKVDWASGVGFLKFGEWLPSTDSKWETAWRPFSTAEVHPTDTSLRWKDIAVNPSEIKYNIVTLTYVPIDGDLLGIDTVRLPQDGRVAIYRPGDVVVLHNTQTVTLANPVTNSMVVDLGRTRLAAVKLYDVNNVAVPTNVYTVDLDAGTVTFSANVSTWTQAHPVKCDHRIEDMRLVTDVQITGQITLMKPPSHDYPLQNTLLSSALLIGDLQARYNTLFDMATWNGVFADAPNTSSAGASFNDTAYPIQVSNIGTIQERWALVFSSTVAFSLYGEYSGLIAVGNIAQDFAPINPNTGHPYFIIPALGWGSGWAASNVLRFNTVAANYPIWIARTTLQSEPKAYTDNFKLHLRGDAN
jgi:hypothetical protein